MLFVVQLSSQASSGCIHWCTQTSDPVALSGASQSHLSPRSNDAISHGACVTPKVRLVWEELISSGCTTLDPPAVCFSLDPLQCTLDPLQCTLDPPAVYTGSPCSVPWIPLQCTLDPCSVPWIPLQCTLDPQTVYPGSPAVYP